ncbi:IpaD/SipD/SspD family type III secretion system needle tip protein [Kluyvera sp. NPDC087067]|uniref:IpaD/SipD/SspD family type III secretion system needle tip protein n=1 Tax=Kluyvera sp. NPDC087067 TaxID=3364105 RepID=UPI0037F896DC
MPIDHITSNPITPAWLLNKTLEGESSVENNQNLTSTDDTAPLPHTTLKSQLPDSVVRALLKPTPSTADDVAKLGKLVENGQISDFQQTIEVIKAKNAMTKLAVEQKKALLAGVAAGLSSPVNAAETSMNDETPAVLTSADKDFLKSARTAAAFTRSTLPVAEESADDTSAAESDDLISVFNDVVKESEYSTSSSKEICDAVADAIAAMGEGYLDIFQEAVEAYASFYADFSEVMANLKKYITVDDEDIKFDGRGFAAELQTVIDKYSGDAGILFSGSSPEEAKAWAKEMGLDPDKCVDGNNVRIDLSSVKNLKNSSYNDYNNKKLNSAQWAAYQSSVDIVKDSVQTGMQSLTQKYSNANSTFDNLVKILSSTISQLLESDKSFFNI